MRVRSFGSLFFSFCHENYNENDWMVPRMPIIFKPISEKEIKSIGIYLLFFFFLFFISCSAFLSGFLLTRENNS